MADADISDEEHPEKKLYKLERINELISTKYNIEEITFRAKFNDQLLGHKLVDVTDELHKLFDDVMDTVNTEHSSPDDKARLSIKHNNLDKAITIHCQPRHLITSSIIMDR